ncbi:hypothetical protein [uncultured Kordia sp.]|uniref:hypothetical protein n=1 Tax=uncultured Kordia sp. TaxID=507699 RepID=UPI00262E3858|nr:hypothetical protein [uncultured Kordia sp.]
MKKFIGVIGGILIFISVFLPSVSVGPISVSLWAGASANPIIYVFMAFGIAVAVCSYMGQKQKWANIVAVIAAILALIMDIIWISEASGSGLATAGMGLWIGAIGCIMGIAGPFIKDKA